MTTSAAQNARGARSRWLPLAVGAGGLGLWALLSSLRAFPEAMFPSPRAVAAAIVGEIANGRLLRDVVASLFRVAVGFVLAVAVGLPLGLCEPTSSRK